MSGSQHLHAAAHCYAVQSLLEVMQSVTTGMVALIKPLPRLVAPVPALPKDPAAEVHIHGKLICVAQCCLTMELAAAVRVSCMTHVVQSSPFAAPECVRRPCSQSRERPTHQRLLVRLRKHCTEGITSYGSAC